MEMCSEVFGGRSEVFGGRSEVFGGRLEVFGGRSEVFGGRSEVFGGFRRFSEVDWRLLEVLIYLFIHCIFK